jgi:hypothetical protein
LVHNQGARSEKAMKHATAAAIARLAPLLDALRAFAELRERTPGTFYRGSQAFLHFHEDAAGDFADVKVGGDWQRTRVSTQRERAALLRRVRALTADSAKPR